MRFFIVNSIFMAIFNFLYLCIGGKHEISAFSISCLITASLLSVIFAFCIECMFKNN